MSVFDKEQQQAMEEAERENEAYQERMEVTWAEEEAARVVLRPAMGYPPLPPYIFADERSQRRTELLGDCSSGMDDYAAWQDEAVGTEQRFR